ncbi:hypothetical protein RRF57_005645 [Xylaria bambusicola]|uniref:Uncharacterized protein n=1 Tax=Xylaria bambusicola TaxID=326684 RepID=A0AAN7YXZ6_9PEZI
MADLEGNPSFQRNIEACTSCSAPSPKEKTFSDSLDGSHKHSCPSLHVESLRAFPLSYPIPAFVFTEWNFGTFQHRGECKRALSLLHFRKAFVKQARAPADNELPLVSPEGKFSVMGDAQM